MPEEYPKPGSPEAVENGCICSAEQANPNWERVEGKCPVHNIDYIIYKATQGDKRKGR